MNTSKDGERRFFDMYQQIADNMQTETSAFTVSDPHPSSDPIRALNLCLAPGGYTMKLLEMHPTMQISGITLAPFAGGHEVLVQDPRLSVAYLDMNLLPLCYGLTPSTLPIAHPDTGHFLTSAPFPGLTYNLVLADGAVLRTHSLDAHRQHKEREAQRLRLAQLIFGLERLKTGGTFVMLLHRIDSFENMVLLRNFEQFAKVTVWKPERYYVQSSSFYLVAKEVQVGHQVAVEVLGKWKAVWQTATFGGKDGMGGEGEEVSSKWVAKALVIYGQRLIELGKPVWDVQARGLGKATYIQPRGGLGKGKNKGGEGVSKVAVDGAVTEKKFLRYMGPMTWFSTSAEWADQEVRGSSGKNQPAGASSP